MHNNTYRFRYIDILKMRSESHLIGQSHQFGCQWFFFLRGRERTQHSNEMCAQSHVRIGFWLLSVCFVILAGDSVAVICSQSIHNGMVIIIKYNHTFAFSDGHSTNVRKWKETKKGCVVAKERSRCTDTVNKQHDLSEEIGWSFISISCSSVNFWNFLSFFAIFSTFSLFHFISIVALCKIDDILNFVHENCALSICVMWVDICSICAEKS